MRADYHCATCDTIFEFKKEYGEDFPKHPECPECSSIKTERSYGDMTFTFPSGTIGGNSANGYTSIKNRRKV